jgi:3-methyladenine DNA glycosylase AlkC
MSQYHSTMNKEKFSLKDQLFNETKLRLISEPILINFPNFNQIEFEKEVISAFPDLELKQRISYIRDCLRKYLPEDFRTAAEIILAALPEPLDENKSDNDFGDFIYAPFSDFIAAYGCNKKDLDFSLNTLKEITKRFSAEYAIRSFINAFPEWTIQTLKVWAGDENYHVRRLCSEGTRPKLPWAQKINIKAELPLPILDLLYKDKTRFVTRSVANHLNDISKINPELVLNTLQRWKESGLQEDSEMNFMIKHALRTLVKSGNKQALAFLGHSGSGGIELSDLQYIKLVEIGSFQCFSFKLKSETSLTVVVDYILYMQNKQGKMNSKKVFKLKTQELQTNKLIHFSKNHLFKADMSTRQLYPGEHRIEIQVNGTIMDGFYFELK